VWKKFSRDEGAEGGKDLKKKEARGDEEKNPPTGSLTVKTVVSQRKPGGKPDQNQGKRRFSPAACEERHLNSFVTIRVPY